MKEKLLGEEMRLRPAELPRASKGTRLVLGLAGLSLSALSLNACGGGRTIEWKQEVRLHDGRVIVVERVSKQTGTIFPENVSLEREQTLTFSHPDTKEKIRWTLPEGLQPAALEFDDNVPYYLLMAYTVADYNKWGCPNPPWLVYRYEQGEWRRVPFEQLPANFVTRNVIEMQKVGAKFLDDAYLTLKESDALWDSSYHRKRMKVISREKVSPIGEGCHESVLIKQGRQAEIIKGR